MTPITQRKPRLKMAPRIKTDDSENDQVDSSDRGQESSTRCPSWKTAVCLESDRVAGHRNTPEFRRAARGDGRAAAAPAGHIRRAGPGGDGSGPARGVRLRAPPLPRLCRRRPADRRGTDDLAAVDRRRDLPGARARGRRAGARGRDGVRLLGRRPRPARRRGDQRRAPSLAGGRGAAQPRLARRARGSRSGSATAAAASPSWPRSMRSRSTPRRRARPGPCSGSSPTAAGSSSRSRRAAPTC